SPQSRFDEPRDRILVSATLIEPAGVGLRLFNGFLHVSTQPRHEVWRSLRRQRRVDALSRPRADERLVEEIFVVGVWRGCPIDGSPMTGVDLSPLSDAVPPQRRTLRQHIQSSPRIFAALGIV